MLHKYMHIMSPYINHLVCRGFETAPVRKYSKSIE